MASLSPSAFSPSPTAFSPASPATPHWRGDTLDYGDGDPYGGFNPNIAFRGPSALSAGTRGSPAMPYCGPLFPPPVEFDGTRSVFGQMPESQESVDACMDDIIASGSAAAASYPRGEEEDDSAGGNDFAGDEFAGEE